MAPPGMMPPGMMPQPGHPDDERGSRKGAARRVGPDTQLGDFDISASVSAIKSMNYGHPGLGGNVPGGMYPGMYHPGLVHPGLHPGLHGMPHFHPGLQHNLLPNLHQVRMRVYVNIHMYACAQIYVEDMSMQAGMCM